MEQPICAHCGQRVAQVLDHIVPLADGGTDTPENRQGLCVECHTVKTAAENRR